MSEFKSGDQVRKTEDGRLGTVTRIFPGGDLARVLWSHGYTERIRTRDIVLVEPKTTEQRTVNHWSVGEIPAQPEPGTAVADRDGVVWVRTEAGWTRAGMIAFGGGTPWSKLLLDHGPLTRLVPAGEADPSHLGRDPKFRKLWAARKRVEQAAREVLDAIDSGVIFDEGRPVRDLRRALAEMEAER